MKPSKTQTMKHVKLRFWNVVHFKSPTEFFFYIQKTFYTWKIINPLRTLYIPTLPNLKVFWKWKTIAGSLLETTQNVIYKFLAMHVSTILFSSSCHSEQTHGLETHHIQNSLSCTKDVKTQMELASWRQPARLHIYPLRTLYIPTLSNLKVFWKWKTIAGRLLETTQNVIYNFLMMRVSILFFIFMSLGTNTGTWNTSYSK